MSEHNERDQVVLAALDASIRHAPKIGICADSFAALKAEFLRVMGERDAAMVRCENQQNHIRALLQANDALKPAIRTNGDRYRCMSDEQLAVVIMCPFGLDGDSCVGTECCVDCCLGWLKDTVQEDDECTGNEKGI